MATANQANTHNRDKLWWWLVALILFAACAGALFGCNTSRRAQKQLTRLYAAHPELVANDCADWFPMQTHDSIRTEYVSGVPVYRYDTVRVDCDTVDGTYRIISLPCPPCATRVDTLLRTWTQVRENTDRVRQFQMERDNARSDLGQAKERLKFWKWIAIGLMLYSAIRIALRLWLRVNLP